MSHSVLWAIAALLTTSLLVRVLPVFVPIQLGAATQRCLERVLPAAVFINFAVYIAYMEVQTHPVAAASSLAVVAGMATLTSLGLITTSVVATTLYFVALQL